MKYLNAAVLIILIISGSYPLTKTISLSLPIPTVVPALTLVLPIISGLVLGLEPKNAQGEGKDDQNISRYLLVALLLIFDTAIATLASTYLGSAETLFCALHSRWQTLYREKREVAVRNIQDGLGCCGFLTPRDMAYPFPSSRDGIGVAACVERYNRTRSCEAAWRGQQQRVAWMVIGLVALTWLWQMLMAFGIPSTRSFSMWLFGRHEHEDVERTPLGSLLTDPLLPVRDEDSRGDDVASPEGTSVTYPRGGNPPSMAKRMHRIIKWRF